MSLRRRISINDVAERAGVSVATVSKVVNGRYGVAEATSKRVMEVVSELGYESSLVARSLRSTRTNVLGILVAEFEPFSTEILKGVSDAVIHTGYELLAYAGHGSGRGVGWEQRSLSRLSGTLIDGAVLVTPTVVDVRNGVPVVAIDPHQGDSSMPTVDSDNYGGARVATEHLIALGHRRIAFLGGRGDLASARQREEGFRAAMSEAGLPVLDDLVGVGGYRRDDADRPAHDLLQREDPPTAVFAANDLMAMAVYDAAADVGLVVPRDLSVVGFDDIPEASTARPPLTTVAQPIRRMGAEATALLVELIAGRDVASTHLRLDTSFVERESTAPPRR